MNKLNNELDRKNAELDALKQKLKGISDSNLHKLDELRNQTNIITELNEIKVNNSIKIVRIEEDNLRLEKYLNELENKNKELEMERARLMTQLNETNFELMNLKSKLQNRESAFEYVKRQHIDLEETVCRMQTTLRESQIDNEKLRNEIQQIIASSQRDVKMKKDMERVCGDMEKDLTEKEREYRRLFNDYEQSRMRNDRLVEDNSKLFGELEKMKAHILVIAEQNQRLSAELDMIGEQDEKIRASLSRKGKIDSLLGNNQASLEKSMSSYGDFRSTKLSNSGKFSNY